MVNRFRIFGIPTVLFTGEMWPPQKADQATARQRGHTPAVARARFGR